MAPEIGIRPVHVVGRISTERSGIEASRTYLRKVWIDEKYCSEGIVCLDQYRKEWNEALGVWSDRPRHDKASHGYKAFETAAVAQTSIDSYEDEYEQPVVGNSITGY
jgi:hypothetical protein